MRVGQVDIGPRVFRDGILFVAVLLLALIAGFFYAYEVSVMRGFAILPDRAFIGAMQAVNATVRNAAFAISFFGSAVVSVAALIVAVFNWRQRWSWLVIGAALFYLVGAFYLTLAINVPLNEWLAGLGAADLIVDPGAVRARYEGAWLFWNRVRMVNSIVALVLMAAAFGMMVRSFACAFGCPQASGASNRRT